MRIVEDVRQFTEALPHVVLTIGSFDGVHLGHRKLVDRVLARAREKGGTAALMTLRPHPREVFSPANAPNTLTPPRMQERLLAEMGLDVLFVLPFNAEVAGLPRDAFLEQLVLERAGARELVVGHDFAFGKGALGNYEYLCEVAPHYNLDVEQVPPFVVRGERVSSTLVRERIVQGELEDVEVFLGRKYAILGEVIRGRGIGGSKLGYPTANIDPHKMAVPAHGVYVAEAWVDGMPLMAAVNIGIAPTIAHQSVMVEAFILDFDGKLVGKEIEVTFLKRLRPEKKYPDYEALVAAIDQDVRNVRAYFAERA